MKSKIPFILLTLLLIAAITYNVILSIKYFGLKQEKASNSETIEEINENVKNTPEDTTQEVSKEFKNIIYDPSKVLNAKEDYELSSSFEQPVYRSLIDGNRVTVSPIGNDRFTLTFNERIAYSYYAETDQGGGGIHAVVTEDGKVYKYQFGPSVEKQPTIEDYSLVEGLSNIVTIVHSFAKRPAVAPSGDIGSMTYFVSIAIDKDGNGYILDDYLP